MNEQNQLLNEEQEKLSDEDTVKTSNQINMPSVVVEKEKEEISVDVIKDKDDLNLSGGRGSRVVTVSNRGWPCHKFEPSTTKDPPCRAAMHVKSVES
ncbi:hypothetical protein TNCV_383581 [Trichonephila clavipes]|nr:hypothetical protein TNCV_383581 [Trichonephila clavipes]